MGFLDPLPPDLMPKRKGEREKTGKNEKKLAGKEGISSTQRIMGEAKSQKNFEKLEDLMEKGKEYYLQPLPNEAILRPVEKEPAKAEGGMFERNAELQKSKKRLNEMI